MDDESEWPRVVFRIVALAEPGSATRVLSRLGALLADTHPNSVLNGPAGQLYALALDCVTSLIRAGREDEALALIDRPETRDLFDVPIRAIEIRRDPEAKAKLATERLALVEAFLDKVGGVSNSELKG